MHGAQIWMTNTYSESGGEEEGWKDKEIFREKKIAFSSHLFLNAKHML